MGRIVVLGGGFAGLNAAIAARRVAGDSLEVLLISRDQWLTIRPRLYEAEPERLKVDLVETLERVGISFRAAEASGFDISGRKILLRDQPSARFDRLVITTGSLMNRPRLPGSNLPFSIDNLSSAVVFDDRLKEISSSDNPTVVIVGGGFTGIELALEMRDRLAVHGGAAAGENARLVLVDRRPVAGAELGEALQGPIEQALHKASIELRMNCDIIELTSQSVRFADGSSIEAGAVVLCTGLIASPITDQLLAEKDEHGRLILDQFLRLPALPFVFGAGDAGRAEAAEGRFTLFSCQHSLHSGKYAGENAARDLLGLPLLRYRHERYVTCLDLGRSGAAFTEGWDRTIRLTGDEAKIVKKRINTQLIYPTNGTSEQILAASTIEGQRRL